eukprot:181297-Pelagomonas_calceolata.AAC.1
MAACNGIVQLHSNTPRHTTPGVVCTADHKWNASSAPSPGALEGMERAAAIAARSAVRLACPCLAAAARAACS